MGLVEIVFASLGLLTGAAIAYAVWGAGGAMRQVAETVFKIANVRIQTLRELLEDQRIEYKAAIENLELFAAASARAEVERWQRDRLDAMSKRRQALARAGVSSPSAVDLEVGHLPEEELEAEKDVAEARAELMEIRENLEKARAQVTEDLEARAAERAQLAKDGGE